jgi:iron complex transport system substrate-binding protein
VVNVPEHPRRLVCLLPSVVDDVYALGAGADVVAVTDYTKYPAEAKAKPSVGLPLAPSMETILSLHPDLVLGSGDLNRMQTLQQLEKLGIAVFAAILASLHMQTADDLFGTPQGSPRTDKLIDASIQWAERIMKRIDNVVGKAES